MKEFATTVIKLLHIFKNGALVETKSLVNDTDTVVFEYHVPGMADLDEKLRALPLDVRAHMRKVSGERVMWLGPADLAPFHFGVTTIEFHRGLLDAEHKNGKIEYSLHEINRYRNTPSAN